MYFLPFLPSSHPSSILGGLLIKCGVAIHGSTNLALLPAVSGSL